MTQLLPIPVERKRASDAARPSDSVLEYIGRSYGGARMALARTNVRQAGVLIGNRGGWDFQPALVNPWRRVRIRQVAIYLTVTEFGVRQAGVAWYLEFSKRNICHACGLVEDLRDDLNFDEAVDEIGALARKLARYQQNLGDS